MSNALSRDRQATPRATRRLAAVAMLVALALLAWRGGSLLFASPPAAAGTPLALLEAIAGPGAVRTSLVRGEDGRRTLVILLDRQAAAAKTDILRLAPPAFGLDPAAGDRIIVETRTFAPGSSARPGPAALAELAALLLLSALTALLAFRRDPAATPAPLTALPDAVPSSPQPRALEPRGQLRPVPAASGEAARLARENPARAAAILRAWIAPSTEERV